MLVDTYYGVTRYFSLMEYYYCEFPCVGSILLEENLPVAIVYCNLYVLQITEKQIV